LLSLDVLKANGDSNPGRFIDILTNTYVSNRRGNRLVTPKEYQTGTSIPVEALDPYEVVSASQHMASMHDYQGATVESLALMEGEDPEAIVEEAQRRLHQSFREDPSLALINEQGRLVMSMTTDIAAAIAIGAFNRSIHARPIMLLSTIPTVTMRSGALEVIHQLSHIDQRLTKMPILDGDLYKSKDGTPESLEDRAVAGSMYRDMDNNTEEERAQAFESRIAKLSLKHLGRQRHTTG
jgi:hypothetical protein